MTSEMLDLRSDTVTKPSAAMRAAMAAAEVGDDGYGEDPTVARLERMTAELFGFSSGLFVPSGVMANQLGLRLLVMPGQELLADANAHFLLYEDAGVAWHGGIQVRTAVADSGLLSPTLLAEMIRPPAPFSVGTQAVAVENTHNRGGGAVYPIKTLQGIRTLADQAGIGVYCDGARLWNAHVSTGASLEDYGACFDTLSVSLSKGLGAPAGAVLLLDADRREEARVMRHRMGGSMRQVGILAAAGIYAIEHNIKRLAGDHLNAKLIAGILQENGIGARAPETNIVLVNVAEAPTVVAQCALVGLKISALSASLVRLVTHLDVTSEECKRAAETLAAVLTRSQQQT